MALLSPLSVSITLLVLLSATAVQAQSQRYQFFLHFPITATNPTNMLANGSCCNTSETAPCTPSCNTRILSCVRRFDHPPEDNIPVHCPFGSVSFSPGPHTHLFPSYESALFNTSCVQLYTRVFIGDMGSSDHAPLIDEFVLVISKLGVTTFQLQGNHGVININFTVELRTYICASCPTAPPMDVPTATTTVPVTCPMDTIIVRPLTTTDIPTTTTALPNSTTDIPTTTTALPNSTTDIPTTTTALPNSTTDIPTTTTALPNSTTDVPTTNTTDMSKGFSLRGVSYPNHGTVLLSEIGEDLDTGLQCLAAQANCCGLDINNTITTPEQHRGEFYYPDGTPLPMKSGAGGDGFFLERGYQLISLSRLSNISSDPPFGLYHCDIPDASNASNRMFINIVEQLPLTATENTTTPESTAPEATTPEATTPTTKAPTTAISSTEIPTAETVLPIQLLLTGVRNCDTWIVDNLLEKAAELLNVLVENLEKRCQCGFTSEQIGSGGFRCVPNTANAVLFQADLFGNARVTSTELMPYIEEWTSEGVDISLQALVLTLDTSCPVVVSSDIDCLSAPPPSTGGSDIGAVLGGIVAVVFILAIIVVAGVAVIALRNRRHTQQRKHGDPYTVENTAYTVAENEGQRQLELSQNHEYELVNSMAYNPGYLEEEPNGEEEVHENAFDALQFSECSANGTSPTYAQPASSHNGQTSQ